MAEDWTRSANVAAGLSVHLDPRTGASSSSARRALAAAGLTATSVHLPFTNDPGPDGMTADERTEAWVRLCEETLHLAAGLRPRTAVAHPVIHVNPNEPVRSSRQRLVGALRRIAHIAAGHDLRLAVENMHELRGPTLRSVADILPAVTGIPRTGICLDVGHAVFNGSTGPRLGDEARAAGRRLMHTHIHDSDRAGADPHLPPGDGIADWPALLSALRSIDYTGRFVLEVDGGNDPVSRLSASRARFAGMLRDAGVPTRD